VSLLTIVQTAALRFGLPLPSVAASSPDQNILQLVGFANEAGQEMAASFTWQNLTKESSFTTVAAQLQGAMTTLAGADFDYVLTETMWNRTQRRPVFGPKSPAEWQQIQAQFMQGPWQQYRIRQNNLYFLPAPPAGQSVFFEWKSKNWATDSTGVTGKTVMTLDTDVALIDERVITLGVIWRYRQAKGLTYAEDFEKYNVALHDEMNRDAPRPRLNLQGFQTDIFPAILVPAGSWTR
jgi:hypothetical protein